MYEPELNRIVEHTETLPEEVRQRFGELHESLEFRTQLPWGEHCTECNAPSCYSSCDLYTPREDGGCRLFVNGMVRLEHPPSVNGYLLKIDFKRWGKLWSVGNIRLLSVEDAKQKERSHVLKGGLVRRLPLPGDFKRRALKKFSYLRRVEAETARGSDLTPDQFMIECYNPSEEPVNLTVTIRSRDDAKKDQPYNGMVTISPGYDCQTLPFSEIAPHIDATVPFDVDVVPSEADRTLLYFGLIDFVREKRAPLQRTNTHSGAKKWKCIVWDLDNTLWDGTLIEDGRDKLQLKDGVLETIKALDERGILHSVASKNNFEDAYAVLEKFGIHEYFLYPRIGWGPKSHSISQIRESLNIGMDTIAFIDDQPFEREEVMSAIPEMAVIDASEYLSLTSREECDVPVTEEGKQRRQFYRQQEDRQVHLTSYEGGYLEFLKECKIRIVIETLGDANMDRVYELAQRTNQMNYSGNRYERRQLDEIASSGHLDTYVIRCEDRFGSYGIVGFGLVDSTEPRLLDLMFSCRIQGKRIEHAFIAHLLNGYLQGSDRGFFVNYRKTPRNEASGKVFDDLSFSQIGQEGDVYSLLFETDRDIPDDGIVEVHEA